MVGYFAGDAAAPRSLCGALRDALLVVGPDAAVTAGVVGLRSGLAGETSISPVADCSPLIGPHSALSAAHFLAGCVAVLVFFSSSRQA